MSAPDVLRSKIALVLTQAAPVAYEVLLLGPSSRRVPLAATRNPAEEPIVLLTPGQARVTRGPVRLLKAIFGGVPPESHADFVSLLVDATSPKTAPILVHALVEIGRLPDLSAVLKHPALTSHGSVAAWAALCDKVAFESQRFTDSDLLTIKGLLRADQGNVWPDDVERVQGQTFRSSSGEWRIRWKARLEEVIDKVRYGRLEAELLEAHNPEINADEEILVSRMEALGFPKETVEALQNLDRKLLEASQAFEFKACIDIARAVLERVLEEAAKAVASKLENPRPLPTDHDRKVRRWAGYLRASGVISPSEDTLVQTLYGLLSNEGSHALGSAPEQARVSKNLVVEVCLLIVGRVQVFK